MFPGKGTLITGDMCFLYRGTHISRDLCFLGRGTHNYHKGYVFPCRGTQSLGICVSCIGEHISLGICVSCVEEHISPV